ncbi:DUF1217 domain-containing protein [Rhodosalinus sp. K401]|uniref:DUF1217 domain-containing protein n=1 Tax=Rhodosalinus sp. K401 TaxID=3239195 RepID=UPI003525763D
MSFQPVLPVGGLAGYRFLERTAETQQAALRQSPALARDTDHFRERIGGIETAAELVADRRLLRVALGAFGLQDDLPNRFFIQKILEDGTARPDALANRLTDDRYKAFAEAFRFADATTPPTREAGFASEIIARFEAQEFEIAVGRQDETMRLALFAARELGTIAASGAGADTQWFRIMGTPPLRRVFETALGLPRAFGQQDIDQQLETFRTRSERIFGSGEIAQFTNEAARDTLVRQFLLRAQIEAAPSPSPGAIALTLLQSAPRLAPLR